MATNWLIEQEIDLKHGVQAPQVWPNALMLCGDNQAHTWRIALLDGGRAAQLTGTVTGYFVRPDGNTVAVQGSLTGNVASVTLAQACYAYEGDIQAVMRLYSGGRLVTLSALILPVRKVLTDSIVDPGNVIPSLDELLAKIAACETATQNANKATSDAKNAEAARASAESARVTAENTRKQQETARQNAEAARASAESARVTAENTRKQQETARQNAETARANAESARVQAEAAREAAERQRAALGFCVVDGKLCVTYNIE